MRAVKDVQMSMLQSFPRRGCNVVCISVVSFTAVTAFAESSPYDPAVSTAPETNEIAVLPPILVTGYKVDRSVPVVPLDAIGSRNVLSPEQIRETGAREINDLIQHLPSISTRPYNGGEAAAPSFSVRGLPDDGLTEYVNVLIDGVPAGPMPYGWTAFSFLPMTPDRIHAIDWARGAHSVRYSPNTVGGVLNFLTPPIPESPTVRLQGTFGDYGYLSLSGHSGGTWNGSGIGVSYGHRQGDGYRDHGGFSQHDVHAKARHQISETDWVSFSVGYMSNKHQAPGGLTQDEFAADRFGSARPRNRFEGDRWVTDAVYHKDLHSGGHIESFVWFSETERNLTAQRPQFGIPDSLFRWSDTSRFVGVGVRGETPFILADMEHVLHGGFRYQREWLPHYRITSEPFSGGDPTLTQDQDFSLDALSFHMDDTIQVTDRLTAQLGVRLEWIPSVSGHDRVTGWSYDDDYITALPGVGVSYLVTDKWALFGNYFLGFRTPQVWGYGSAAAAGNALVFEESRSAEIGSRWELPAGWVGTATFWRNEYDDLGVFYDGNYNNLGQVTAQGVDMELAWDVGQVLQPLTGLSLASSFTLQDSEIRSGPFRGNDVPYAWHQKAAWRLRYARYGWTALLGGTYVGDSFADEANTTADSADGRLGVNPERVLWDARLAKLFFLTGNADVELSVGASNLFGQDWHMHSRGGFFGPGLAAGPPRQLYGSMALNLRF